MILIGNRALALRAPQALKRKPCDFDWVCTKEEFDTWLDKNREKVGATKVYELPEFNKQIVEGATNCEFEIITPGTSSELLADLVKNDPETFETPFGQIPNFHLLFAIKDAHKYKKFESPRGCANWYKHATDWHVMRAMGAEIRPEYKEFHKLREKETYNNKLPKLNVSKNAFFDSDQNGVIQTYIHDDIHLAVAIGEKPAYLYYLKEGSEVLTDNEKFFSVSEEVRLNGVKEEAIVLSIERSQIPHPGVWSPAYSLTFALGKVCSSITGGKFREYAFLNLFKALQEYPKNYWENFQKAVADGKVRLFNDCTADNA